jgi:hypothetical protein
LENKPETLKTIYRKLWLCDEFSDSEIVASILSLTDTIPQNPGRSRFVLVTPVPFVIKQNKYEKRLEIQCSETY